MPVFASVRRVMFLLLFGVALVAQTSSGGAAGQKPMSTPEAAQQPAQNPDEMTQMRDDLNKMESLNMNMSSEIEFLHDQNLQILLRTNSQMWTILIRDLRRQVERQEQQKVVAPPSR